MSPIREQYEHMQSDFCCGKQCFGRVHWGQQVSLAIEAAAKDVLIQPPAQALIISHDQNRCASEFAHEIDIASANILSERLKTDRTVHAEADQIGNANLQLIGAGVHIYKLDHYFGDANQTYAD